MQPKRILIVDDDADILDLLRYNLQREGYEVMALTSEMKAVSAARKFEPHLIILDVMMPYHNGIDLCRKLRAKPEFQGTHIFFLSARSESYYQHAAFDSGGDDYIEKMTGIKALTGKIGAVLKHDVVIRKCQAEICLGEIRINRVNKTVQVGGVVIRLSPPEADLLFFLSQNAGKLVPNSLLMQSLWGSDVFLGERNLDIYVDSIERKVGTRLIERYAARYYSVRKI